MAFYHYSKGCLLQDILKSGELLPRRFLDYEVNKPVIWLTTNTIVPRFLYNQIRIVKDRVVRFTIRQNSIEFGLVRIMSWDDAVSNGIGKPGMRGVFLDYEAYPNYSYDEWYVSVKPIGLWSCDIHVRDTHKNGNREWVPLEQ